MEATWIVVANAGRARLFSRLGRTRRLAEIGDMVNTAVRLRTEATESDALGQHAASKSRHSVGAPTQPSGYEPHQTPAEHQTEGFARSIAHHLRDARLQGRYAHLILIASPEFLGVLRKQLDTNLSTRILAQIAKDYTQCTPIEIMDHMESNLDGA